MDTEGVVRTRNPSCCDKERKIEKKRKKNVKGAEVEGNRGCVPESFLVKDTPSADDADVADASMEVPPDATTSGKEKKKDKRRKKMRNLMDCESSVLISTDVEIATPEFPADATSEREERKEKRRKRRGSIETNSVVDCEGVESVPTQENGTDLDNGADVTLRKKERKKKKKKNKGVDDGGMKTHDEERTIADLKEVESADVTWGKKKKRPKRSGVDETTAKICEPSTVDATSGKKKSKKNNRSSDGVEMVTVDDDTCVVPAADGTSKKGRKKPSKIVEMTAAVSTEVDDKNRELVGDVDSGKKKKKKKPQGVGDDETTTMGKEERKKETTRSSDVVEMEIVDIVVDANSGKKKRQKRKSRGDDVEAITVDDDKSTLLFPTKVDVTSVLPETDVTSGKTKRERKKKVKTGDNLETTVVDNEKIVAGSSQVIVAVDGDECLESQVSQDLVRPLKNKSPEIDPLNETAYETDTVGASQNPLPSTDLSCSSKKKRKRKEKKIYEAGESLADTLMKSDAVDSTETVQPSDKSSIEVKPATEHQREDSNLSLVNDQDKVLCVANAKDLEKNDTIFSTDIVGLSPSGKEENSLTIKAQSGPPNGLSNGSLTKLDKEIESSIDLESEKKFEPHLEINGVLEKVDDPLAKKDTDLGLDVSDKEGNISQVPATFPERTLVSPSRKKLLILDVNGLLVDFVNYNPKDYEPDIVISKKYVYKRPFCDEFIQFCFENFTVGVWSSRMKWNMDKVIEFLFRETRKKLLFCWDQSHCTMTKFNTVENQGKPLVLKELRNVWDKVEPALRYEKGDYDETNTLLLDDSPYKSLRNPANTAIFPKSYSYTDREDKSLGPGGSLRTYLEGLLLADNVQKYVEQNPFGQPAITKLDRSWSFYKRVIDSTEKVSKL